MKLARIGSVGQEITAVVHNGQHFDLRSITSRIDGAFFSTGGLERAAAALAAGSLPLIEGADAMRVGAPIDQPTKIVCVGLNYREHAIETGAPIPTEPVVFMKDPSTIVGAFDDVLIPRGSVKTDWEVELGIVIGSDARYLTSPEDSAAHIAGYVLSHDVSEREFQLERGGQWDKGKSCETFNPLGPWLATADEVENVSDLGMHTWVNGVKRQDGSTSTMIFDPSYIVWYLSQFMVLRAGDLINTGTPSGVGLAIEGTPYLRDGDVVELDIDGLGRARQQFVQA